MNVKEFIQLLEKMPQEAIMLAYDREIEMDAIVQGVEHNEKYVQISTTIKESA